MNDFNKHIHKHSINNTRLGRVLIRDNTTYTVRIDNTEITCDFSGGAYVGDYVTLICPDGDFTRAYIISSTAIGIGEGGNVAI